MELPTDTVTFLFTDIEGSARLWDEHPEEMRTALARHETILQQAVGAQGGCVFKMMGDQFCVAFARATDALTAALEAQRALQAEPWPVGPLRVRMALHTGEAEERGGDYFGPPLNRCSRVLTAGHGGQVLLSRTSAHIVREALPPGVQLKPLGEHRLRDLTQPEDIFQLLHPDLPSEFPPLRSLAAFTHNLPVQLTSFVGREKELEEVKGLLRTTRLLTLTGTGGAGKTRLALQAGADLLDEYADGVWLVDLAALSDPSLVPQAVLSALGLREEPQRSLTDTLFDALRPKRALLILDNCEHLVEACAHLAEGLLRACPKLRILATSRQDLTAEGEVLWRVPSLALPDRESQKVLLWEQLTQYGAVQLFIERAIAARPGFSVTNENAPAVAEICWRLDGIPLAVELAAARVNVLSPEQIEARLDDRFRLLTGGRRTALPRQQTLQAAVEWSYDLLSEQERRLFDRLSVFTGSFGLEAAEAVGLGDDLESWEVLDRLAGLVAKSLVAAEAGGEATRYRLLETLRAYGLERLDERGEAAVVRRRHGRFVIAFAEQAKPYLRGPDQARWLARLEAEHDNLRAALAWGLQEDVASGFALLSALFQFWIVGCHWSEGRRWADEYLARAEEAPAELRADALVGASALALYQSDCAQAEALAEEALRLSREIGYHLSVARALSNLGNAAARQGRHDVARSRHEEGLSIGREIGDRLGVAVSLLNLGWVADLQGDPGLARTYAEECLEALGALDRGPVRAQALNNLGNLVAREGHHDEARAMYEESLALWREMGDDWGSAQILMNLGLLVEGQGDLARARSLHEETLATMRRLGARRDTAIALRNLAGVMQEEGDHAEAATRYAEAAAIALDLGDRHVVLACLEGLAILLRQRGWALRAARALGAAEALRQVMGVSVVSFEAERYERELGATREALGEAAFGEAWAAGQAMTLDEAVTEALQDEGIGLQ